MCAASLLFTLYHTVRFANDMRKHMQVGGGGGWRGGQGRARGRGGPPIAARRVLAAAVQHHCAPPPSPPPAVQSEARADWRALLRYAWNAIFWAGFVCWWA